MRIEQEKGRAAKARELFPGNFYKDLRENRLPVKMCHLKVL